MKRFVDLTADETSDLWFTAKKVGSQLERFHSATSLTFAIQVRKLLINSCYLFFFLVLEHRMSVLACYHSH